MALLGHIGNEAGSETCPSVLWKCSFLALTLDNKHWYSHKMYNFQHIRFWQCNQPIIYNLHHSHLHALGWSHINMTNQIKFISQFNRYAKSNNVLSVCCKMSYLITSYQHYVNTVKQRQSRCNLCSCRIPNVYHDGIMLVDFYVKANSKFFTSSIRDCNNIISHLCAL